ncbi:MAG: tRNA pseudouridine(55) synthase TruB [Chloroflexi bacterium]|nr:tRNA pseudouridine(55) synthase TruB [Chloroflexota bacterium]
MEGVLNIDKPQGLTSFDVVAAVRRLSRQRRVGHAGTLDPMATGVLPVCLGYATRLIEYLADTAKTYRAWIELGIETDTYDATGSVTSRADPSEITPALLEKGLAAFRGDIEQTPPMYSAAKYQGQPLYRLARAGLTVERKSRPAHIYRLEIVDWQPPVITIEVDCGKGTYIRSLAHDLGQSLGCGATLKQLVRTRYGPFDLAGATSLDRFLQGDWQSLLHPPDTLVQHWKAALLSEASAKDVSKGCPVSLASTEEQPLPGERRRAYSPDGSFLAVLRFDSETGLWRPEKVFLSPRPAE